MFYDMRDLLCFNVALQLIGSLLINILSIKTWHFLLKHHKYRGCVVCRASVWYTSGNVTNFTYYTVLLIKFLPSLPVTAERGSAPSAHYPPERATSGIATCSVVGDTYRAVAKLSPALGWWTLPCLACLWARIRARPAKQSTGWRNTVANV